MKAVQIGEFNKCVTPIAEYEKVSGSFAWPIDADHMSP